MHDDDATRWTLLSELVADAIEQPAPERERFLRKACGGDDVLLREAESLLAAHLAAEAEDALAHPFSFPVPPVPRRVGPWELDEPLGTGGMGVVYRAHRADGLYEREVALKRLRPDLIAPATEATRSQRFHTERQLLARLEHPGIARLYDSGVDEDGIPYLVMELVRGEPVTAYARRQNLDPEACVRLGLDICDAVVYAHQRLVVHRDLKPSNVFVTEDGTVKLLDFGIAKLLDADQRTDQTKTQAALTPSYAAPEQFRRGEITTATDVYALGVLLYELLAGQRPYDLNETTSSEAERLVCDIEPPRPSEVAATPQARTLRGDLDTIVMKALAKEPERRYPSAEALADDLRRYLAGMPIEARPATTAYRMGRFVRRHRAGVAAAVAVVLFTTILVGFYTVRLTSERDRTAAALAQAEGALAFLENTILLGGPEEGDPEAPIGAVLDSAATRVEERAASPEIARRVHATLANVYLGQGRLDRAEYHAERALSLYEDERDAGAARVLSVLATVRSDAGQGEAALPLHEEAVRRLRAARASDHDLAQALNAQGATLFALGRPAEAEAAYREAADRFRRARDPDVVMALHNLSVLMSQQGRAAEAADVLRQIVAELRQRTGKPAAYQLSFALVSLANALSSSGENDEALSVYREALAAYEDALGPEHPETIAARTSLANHLYRMEAMEEAAAQADAALATATATLPPGHPYIAYVQSVAGTLACEDGRAETGVRLLRASLDARRASLPEGHWLLANGESVLGGCLARLGPGPEARRLLEQGYRTLLEALGPEHDRTREARQRLRQYEEAAG